MSDHDHGTPRHPIAVVSRRTGLSQLVLRAWERRYGAVVPGRTDTGRRLYSDDDLEKLNLLRQLTQAGHRIGDLSEQPLEVLTELAAETLASLPAAAAAGERITGEVDVLLREAVAAVTALDAEHLGDVLQRAAIGLSKPVLRRDLIVPLLETVGEHWRTGVLRVAHEHMASAVIRSFLMTLNARHRPSPGAPVLVAGTPQGQLHELGTLLGASHALEMGWDVLYLGADLPPEDLAAAAIGRQASALLISLVYPYGDPATATALDLLRNSLGPDTALIVGGAAASSYADTLARIGADVVGNQDELDAALRRALA